MYIDECCMFWLDFSMVLNNLIEIQLTLPSASDFKSNLFNRVKVS